VEEISPQANNSRRKPIPSTAPRFVILHVPTAAASEEVNFVSARRPGALPRRVVRRFRGGSHRSPLITTGPVRFGGSIAGHAERLI
jgi:hypothetical protein